MKKKIVGILVSIAVLAAVGLIVKSILIDKPAVTVRDIPTAYKKAEQKSLEAEQLRQKGELFSAAEKCTQAANYLRSAWKYNKKDARAEEVRSKAIALYEKGISLFIRDALNQPVDKSVRVVIVIDGDTVDVEGGERIRYLGINTPEVAHGKGTKDKPFGQQARRTNAGMVKNRIVKLKYDKDRKGVHGRTLAYVFSGSRFVNAELVKRGLAKYYAPSGSSCRYKPLFLACESLARLKKLGMWRK